MPLVVDPTTLAAGARETIVLDPIEIATGRSEIDLHAGSFRVREEGPDWGDAAITAYMSELARGELPVDFRVPNRQITIPLTLLTQGGALFTDARRELQQKIGLFQRKGGWLKREMADGSKLYADIVTATLKLGGSSFQAQQQIDPDVQITLEALPDFYEDEDQLLGGS